MPSHNISGSLDLLLQYCYQNKSVLRYAAKLLRPEHLDHQDIGGNDAHRIIFGILKDYWDKHQDLMAWAWFKKEIMIAHHMVVENDDFGISGDGLKARLLALVKHIRTPLSSSDMTKTQPLSSLVNDIYRLVEGNPRVLKAAEESVLAGDYDTVASEVRDVSSKMTTNRAPCRPFDKASSLRSESIISGITWFDNLFGEFRRGQAYLVLGPTGGGKTTLTRQLSVALGLQGRNVCMVYSEQTMREAEMIDGFYAVVTQRPMSDFRDFATFEEIQAAGLLDARTTADIEMATKHVQVFDFAEKPGDLDEVRAIALGEVGDGSKPDFLILDWVGSFAEQLVEINERRYSGSDGKASAIREIADTLVDIAREAHIPVVMLHQIAPNQIGGPMKAYNHTHAMECRSISVNVPFCAVICPADENSITRIDVTKGRWGAKQTQIVKLDGARSRFVALNNYYRSPTGYQLDGAVPGKIPDASKKKKEEAPIDMTDEILL